MKAVILLSGGMSSTVLLAHMLANHAGLPHGHDCRTLTLAYGQHNAHQEIAAAHDIAHHYGVPHHIAHVPDVFGPSALTADPMAIPLPSGLPVEPDATQVVGRNLVFLAIGVAWAARLGYTEVMYGPVEDKDRCYPDCGWQFIQSMDDTAYQGSGGRVRTHAPLRHCTLAQVVQIGVALDIPFELTWSCHAGGEEPCGQCGACTRRQQALVDTVGMDHEVLT